MPPVTFEMEAHKWIVKCECESHQIRVVGYTRDEAEADWRRLASPAKQPFRCPVCGGSGEFGRLFHTPCHACGGKGVLWGPE